MIKRLAGCIRQYKRDTVLTPLFMLGEVSCECVIPLLTAELINNIQAGCSMNVILQFGLKAMNLEEGATAKDRNAQIGGHKA